MTIPPAAADTLPPDTVSDGHGQVAPAGMAGRVLFVVGLAFATFQIYTAAFSPLASIVQRSLHVGFLLLLTFLLFRRRGGASGAPVPWYDWVLGLGAFALAFYHWVFEADLIVRAGDPTTLDLVFGVALVALVFEGARRIMGWVLPLLCIVFVPYALFGRELPGFLIHRGYDFAQVVDTLALGTEGIYGVPTYVSATFIFLFILFGALLERAGMVGLFNDLALGTVGHHKGGPAKVAVISSGLMGTINGSGVANVLTTGQFTIRLMMRFGYRPHFAGAVEATASMGGQIMPPVMGAVAFIMAETIGVPYAEIALAAIVPAMLYYVSAFWMVHLEADRAGLRGLTKAECPNAWRALIKGWHLLLPLAALVWLLFSGFTPLFSGTIGMALTALLIFGGAVLQGVGAIGLRIAFWLALACVALGINQLAGARVEQVAIALVAVLLAVTALRRPGRETIVLLANGMVDAAKSALGVGMACALVGILIGVMQLTGLASSLAGAIVAIAGNNLLIALLLTMVACIVLGTGLPTIPNYIITSAIAAPVLKDMGVELIVSHMFVFYFGIMADLTPPVALAALAASSIARAPHMKIALTATKIAVAGYVVPFMAVYTPALMLQYGDGSDWTDTLYVVFKALVSIGLWGGAATAWLRGPLNWPERIWATAGALMLVMHRPWTDEIGFALVVAFLAWHWWRTRTAPAPV